MSTPENFLDAPIPGQSLTAEPKSRPWRRPSSATNVDQAAAIYAPMFADKIVSKMLLEQIQSGIPLTSLADLLITANTMEGAHSLDVGLLIAPVLVETMVSMAEMADVEYVIGNERNEDAPGTKMSVVDEVLRNLKEEEDGEKDDGPQQKPVEEEEEMMQQQQQQETPPRGLMAPRRAV